jgi:hypothetical protein
VAFRIAKKFMMAETSTIDVSVIKIQETGVPEQDSAWAPGKQVLHRPVNLFLRVLLRSNSESLSVAHPPG